MSCARVSNARKSSTGGTEINPAENTAKSNVLFQEKRDMTADKMQQLRFPASGNAILIPSTHLLKSVSLSYKLHDCFVD